MFKCLLISTFLLSFSPDATWRGTAPTCEEIKVEVTTENAGPTGAGGKITIRYEGGIPASSFTLNLYAERRADNKLDLSGTEIKELKKGKYILMIVAKEQTGYCPKQVTLQIN